MTVATALVLPDVSESLGFLLHLKGRDEGNVLYGVGLSLQVAGVVLHQVSDCVVSTPQLGQPQQSDGVSVVVHVTQPEQGLAGGGPGRLANHAAVGHLERAVDVGKHTEGLDLEHGGPFLSSSSGSKGREVWVATVRAVSTTDVEAMGGLAAGFSSSLFTSRFSTSFFSSSNSTAGSVGTTRVTSSATPSSLEEVGGRASLSSTACKGTDSKLALLTRLCVRSSTRSGSTGCGGSFLTWTSGCRGTLMGCEARSPLSSSSCTVSMMVGSGTATSLSSGSLSGWKLDDETGGAYGMCTSPIGRHRGHVAEPAGVRVVGGGLAVFFVHLSDQFGF